MLYGKAAGEPAHLLPQVLVRHKTLQMFCQDVVIDLSKHRFTP